MIFVIVQVKLSKFACCSQHDYVLANFDFSWFELKDLLL